MDVRSGEHLMGDEFDADGPVKLKVFVRGTGPVARVDIIKDFSYVYSTEPKNEQVEFEWTDDEQGRPAGLSWYYVRAIQDRRRARLGQPDLGAYAVSRQPIPHRSNAESVIYASPLRSINSRFGRILSGEFVTSMLASASLFRSEVISSLVGRGSRDFGDARHRRSTDNTMRRVASTRTDPGSLDFRPRSAVPRRCSWPRRVGSDRAAIPCVAGDSHRTRTGVPRMRTRKRHTAQPMLEPMETRVVLSVTAIHVHHTTSGPSPPTSAR